MKREYPRAVGWHCGPERHCYDNNFLSPSSARPHFHQVNAAASIFSHGWCLRSESACERLGHFPDSRRKRRLLPAIPSQGCVALADVGRQQRAQKNAPRSRGLRGAFGDQVKRVTELVRTPTRRAHRMGCRWPHCPNHRWHRFGRPEPDYRRAEQYRPASDSASSTE